MISTKRFSLLFLCFGIICITACQEGEDQPGQGTVIVVNEGQFGAGNGTLGLYDPILNAYTDQAFETVNQQGLSAGVQSVHIHREQAYILCNAADKIEIVNPQTLERLVAPIEDTSLITPRYMTTVGNKGYVSVWGPYDENYNLPNSRVFVLNLDNQTIIQKIATNAGPEGILAVDQKVFVANSFTNTLSVINAQTDAVDTILVINSGPSLLALDQDEMLWVSTTGGFGGTPAFVQLNPDTYEIMKTVSAAGTGANGKFTLNVPRDSLFFIGSEPYPSTESAIYGMSIQATNLPENPLIVGNSFYGLGIDPNSNILYVGLASSFDAEGTVLRYQTNGTMLDNFASGIAPNGFVFP